jgi:hypothetical protein
MGQHCPFISDISLTVCGPGISLAVQAASGWLCGRKNVTIIYNDALDSHQEAQDGEERTYR